MIFAFFAPEEPAANQRTSVDADANLDPVRQWISEWIEASEWSAPTPSTNIDIGTARAGELQLQYAVYEWANDLLPLNDAASAVLGRFIHGPCVVWGLGMGGESKDYPLFGGLE